MGHEPLHLALIGCGAVTEVFYVPALKELEGDRLLRVSVLVDPSAERRAVIGARFPGAERLEGLAALRPPVDMAIVASPAALHAQQTMELLRQGVHVLCEKPMAVSSEQCETMIAEATRAKRLLGVGLFRRFFGATGQVQRLVAENVLGRPTRFALTEGSRFQWPARSDSFFRREQAGGGVLLDLGSHVLDLMLWWFGEPSDLEYEDDAMGGLEANCRLRLRYGGGLEGTVRLSRDWTLRSRYYVQFERGWLGWSPADPSTVEIGLSGEFALQARIHRTAELLGQATIGEVGPSYQHSFIRQIESFARSVQGEEPLAVPGAEGMRSIRLIEACYRSRQLMPMPWLTPREAAEARRLTC
jgi:predicted dehydrogenase